VRVTRLHLECLRRLDAVGDKGLRVKAVIGENCISATMAKSLIRLGFAKAQNIVIGPYRCLLVTITDAGRERLKTESKSTGEP